MTARPSAPTIAQANAEGRAALIGYLPIGYPTVDASVAAAIAMAESGVDIIELGLPYSDPLMEGPVIEAAVYRALQGGARPKDTLNAVAAVAATGVPTLIMTYWNPVERYGVERFADDLAAAGGAGLITPDIIPDEAAEWISAAEARDLERVFLVAPSSTEARVALTVKASSGWVYAASTMGVTGMRTGVDQRALDLVARTRAAGAEHVCVGLGVSNAAQAAEVAGFADGVIVGSAFVRALGDAGDIGAVRALAQELRVGVQR